MSAVLTHDVRRTFGDHEVLRGIDLDVRPDEFVALLGRSGSGKTTLLRALAGLDPLVEGDVFVPERRSVVFQDPRLLPWATVLDNVVLGQRGSDALTRIRMHVLVQELCARHRPAVLLITHDVDEALLLADRVLVLVDGRISLDVAVDVPSPRLRGDDRFVALRSRLLAELGVDEHGEGARHQTTAPHPQEIR